MRSSVCPALTTAAIVHGLSTDHDRRRGQRCTVLTHPVSLIHRGIFVQMNRSTSNPEDLLISALSACHMLWYLHLASKSGIVVTGYRDDPMGYGETLANGAGRFLSAVLRPTISVVEGTDLKIAAELHHKVDEYCFIARSVNFPVRYEPTFDVVAC